MQQDLTEDLLPLVLDPIITALKDDDDDVRAVAASALLPVAESLVTFASNRVSTASFTCSTVQSLMLQPLGSPMRPDFCHWQLTFQNWSPGLPLRYLNYYLNFHTHQFMSGVNIECLTIPHIYMPAAFKTAFFS